MTDGHSLLPCMLTHLGLRGVFHVVHWVTSLRAGLVSHGGGRDAESEKQGQSWNKSSAATEYW